MGRIQDALEELRGEVSETGSAIDSAIVFINGLVNRLGEALMSDDLESQIQDLRDELDAQQAKLATAVAENTAAAEDSDDFYDPAPIGEDFEDGEPTLEPEVGGSGESDSVADNSTQPASDSADYAGEGAVSDDTAVDTSATTDSPTYGNDGAGDSSGEASVSGGEESSEPTEASEGAEGAADEEGEESTPPAA